MTIQPDAFKSSDKTAGVSSSSGVYVHFFKRVFDILAVVIASPLMIVVIGTLALMTAYREGRPFYGHQRIGKNGKPFYCWKIRTMAVESDRLLREHLEANPEARREWDKNFKLDNDPRITRIGGFLRKTSLDELPQLWNVFKGEMSLVGPRPVTQVELERYGKHLDAYLSQRPGVTGKWQISGRNDISYQERVIMDAAYRNECSLMNDLKIIIGTVGVVFKRTGK